MLPRMAPRCDAKDGVDCYKVPAQLSSTLYTRGRTQETRSRASSVVVSMTHPVRHGAQQARRLVVVRHVLKVHCVRSWSLRQLLHSEAELQVRVYTAVEGSCQLTQHYVLDSPVRRLHMTCRRDLGF